MKKLIVWLLIVGALGFGGYRIWDRNTHRPAPVAIEMQTCAPGVALPCRAAAPAPVPPAVAPPVEHKAPHVAKPAPHKPVPPKGGGKAKPRPHTALVPAAAPARPASDAKFPRGADAGSSVLPVSCEKVRWYAENAPRLGKALAAAYHPTAAQLAAAKACLKG